jgi:hypothetical protein
VSCLNYLTSYLLFSLSGWLLKCFNNVRVMFLNLNDYYGIFTYGMMDPASTQYPSET